MISVVRGTSQRYGLCMRKSFLLGLLAAFGLAWATTAEAADAGGDRLELRGMTFVASEGGRAEVVVEAARAELDREAEIAELEQVRLRLAGDAEQPGFAMTCDRGELDLRTYDFHAVGHVEGRTGDGRRFSSPWLRYSEAEGVAFTDAPVVIRDGPSTFRGAGLRYHVREGRLQLLEASLVQSP